MRTITFCRLAILLLFLVEFISSCQSDKLSRSLAEKIIKENLGLPKENIRAFIISDWSGTAVLKQKKFELLESSGFLTYNKKSGLFVSLYGKLTEKGQQYAVSGIYRGEGLDYYNQH